MKVLFFIECLTLGGKERRLTELMKALKPNPNVEFELVLMSEDIYYKEVLDLGINIHYLVRKTKKDFSIFRKFHKICNQFRPDMVHCWDSMTSIYAIPACSLLNIKLINGTVVDVPAGSKLGNKFWVRAKFSFYFSSVVVGNTIAGLKAYHAPSRRSTYIYNGFDFRRVANIASVEKIKEKFGLKAKQLVLMVAAFGDRKDYDSFVDAARTVCEKNKDVEFIAVGNGKNLHRIAQKIGDGMGGRIRLLGEQTSVESIVNASDVCVLMTNARLHGEGISNSILEYMALSKPVVASVGGGTSEIVEDGKTGFLVQPGSAEQLGAKLEILLADAQLRQNMGAAGKKRIEDHFSIDLMIRKYLELYESLKKNNTRLAVVAEQ